MGLRLRARWLGEKDERGAVRCGAMRDKRRERTILCVLAVPGLDDAAATAASLC